MRFIKFFENFSTRYFDDITDLNSLNKRYRKLALENHPDRAGDDERERVKKDRIMQEINSQKEEAEKRINAGFKKDSTSSNTSGANSDKTDYSREQEQQRTREQEQEQQWTREQEQKRAREERQRAKEEEKKSQQKAREEQEQRAREERRRRKRERGPRQKKPTLTAEEIQKIKSKAVADYKETMSKAKSSKERKDIRAKEDFDNKVKQNPSGYDSARFAYKRVISQNEEEYQKILRNANATYNKLTKDL